MNKPRQPKEIEAIYPLTYLQEGILYHCIYNDNSDVYFEQFTCKLSGKFDPEAFKASWEEVISRHSIFRTSFVWKNSEQMMQVVQKKVKLPYRFYDWAHIPFNTQTVMLESFLSEDKKEGFKLNSAPLIRLSVIRLAQEEYQFIWSHHHLLIDGWSRSVLLKEVFEYYNSFGTSHQISLAPTRPFRDYVLWLRSRDGKKDERFWKNNLKGFNSPTRIPFESNNAEVSGQAVDNIILPAKISEALHSYARKNRITLNTILQGAWAILLMHYSGNKDVLYGMTVSGRQPEFENIESMIGLFINTIPLRIIVEESKNVSEWLQELQVHVIETRDYEFSPLVQVKEWSEIPGDIPLFHSLFVFENYPVDEAVRMEIQNLSIRDIRTSSRTNYPLVLSSSPEANIPLIIDYDKGKYSPEVVKMMLTHLSSLLNAIVLNPDKTVGELSILDTEKEEYIIKCLTGVVVPKDDSTIIHELSLLSRQSTEDIIRSWNKSETESEEAKEVRLFHRIFEEVASRMPDTTAVVSKESSLSYSELNSRANRLANYLKRKGVKADEVVGMCISRKADLVVSILGIM
ncbi:MAG: condensation domain-containing protein, partial [Ignavibacteriales bacterium]